MIASLQIGNLTNFQFWQFSIFATCQFSILSIYQLRTSAKYLQFSILAVFNFDNFQFWQNTTKSRNFQFWQFWRFSILATSILPFFNFINFQFWQLSVFTIFNLGYFQANFLNGSQEQEEQQHINCMDLATKNMMVNISSTPCYSIGIKFQTLNLFRSSQRIQIISFRGFMSEKWIFLWFLYSVSYKLNKMLWYRSG